MPEGPKRHDPQELTRAARPAGNGEDWPTARGPSFSVWVVSVWLLLIALMLAIGMILLRRRGR